MFEAGTILTQAADGTWKYFRAPERVLIAHRVAELPALWAGMDAAQDAGLHVAGVVAYEAAGGVDAALQTQAPAQHEHPLAWFGVYRDVVSMPTLPLPDVAASRDEEQATVAGWQADTDQATYAEALRRIRAYIAAGDTYQVNYTIRLRRPFCGDPYHMFLHLQAAQQARCGLYADLGDVVVCSASPELFFEIADGCITARPMKGTAPRGMTEAEDERVAAALSESRKNRSENVMIVDMIRNDLGRIAEPGSVVPAPLFTVERYPTVHQMVSRVRARLRSGVSFGALMQALFPCASITGAPKVRTMQIISELEASPRGYYTGMGGYRLASGAARFQVLIRTVTIDRCKQQAEYGTGGGIVWDSVAEQEYEECLAKAAILGYKQPRFALLETIRYHPQEGFAYLAQHVERAASSARYFGYPFDAGQMQQALDKAVVAVMEPVRVRWLLERDGTMRVETHVLGEMDVHAPVGLARRGSVRSDDVFLYHKTTHRVVYEKALQHFPGCRDVILVNEQGAVTESCYANVVVARKGQLLTPAVACGLLDGTLRRGLVQEGQLAEATICVEDLLQADRVWLINSVRGWMDVGVRQLRQEPEAETPAAGAVRT